MRMLLGEATSIDLEPLPDSPDLIPEHITKFFSFALPISDCKQTRAVLEELTFYVKDNIPNIAAQVSITDYDTASQTIRTIQDHFNFTLIPNYFIDLPDLPTPE
ncbi:13758_t:CDS:2 [Gigaspora margarita]|uniref:13758_t:CDS:1 n=1 Tax=Gigaspora margarita TaxID=4874 RepID=A0ABM8W7C5_GIGMA|nr:13758_t:CDS:2 [Gigaspora margarita]